MFKNPFKLEITRTEQHIVLPIIFFASIFVGADINAVGLMDLRLLSIPYPAWMDYGYLIMPAGCAMLWLLLKRRWPRTGSIIPLFLCPLLLAVIPAYVGQHIARLPVLQSMTNEEVTAMEYRLGFPLIATFSNDGTFLMTESTNGAVLKAELVRLENFKTNER